MANRLLRLTVHDPGVIKALDALRKTRKQSAFVVEALRHFLGTVEGQEQLASFLALEAEKPPTPAAKKPASPEETPLPRPGPKANLDDIFKL
jgi:hypothetical protein